jgi:hypothetical protein
LEAVVVGDAARVDGVAGLVVGMGVVVVAGVVAVVGEDLELLGLPQLAAASSKPPITRALNPKWR